MIKATKHIVLVFLLGLCVISCQRDPQPFESYIPSDGTINGLFSVSESRCIYFAAGTLSAKQDYKKPLSWFFQDDHYDEYLTPEFLLKSYGISDVELFQYGTSGYNSANPGVNNPISFLPDFDIEGTNYDWGLYCSINGGEEHHRYWRLLSKSEWNYLFDERKDAALLKVYMNVNRVPHLLLLPDDWNTSNKHILCEQAYGSLINQNCGNREKRFIQQLGGVFLPCYKSYDVKNSVYSKCMYWTSTYGCAFSAYDGITNEYVSPDNFLMVQLVIDAK